MRRVRGIDRRAGRSDDAACGEQDLILHIERESVAAAVVAERIGRSDLQRLRVDDRNAARPLLENLVDRALVVADRLLRRAAEIDVAEHRCVPGVHHHQALGRVAADVDAIVSGVTVDAVGTESLRDFDRLDQLHGLDVEHRGLRMVAGEAVAGVRAHRRAVAAHTRNHADRFERVEVEDGHALFKRRYRRRRRGRLARLRGAAGDVQPPADGVCVDVVRAALAADPRSPEHFIWTRGLREHDRRERCGGCDQQQSQSSHGRCLTSATEYKPRPEARLPPVRYRASPQGRTRSAGPL